MGNNVVCGSKRSNHSHHDRSEAYGKYSEGDAPQLCERHNASVYIGPTTTALINAVRVGHVSCVKALLTAGADVNRTNDLGYTAFNYHHFKPIGGHSACLHLVLQAGADLTLVNNYGGTALHTAAENGHEGCVEFLLKAGADVNTQDYDGRTALILAALKGRGYCVYRLIEAGADVNTIDTLGNTPLIKAARSGYYHTVDMLIKAGADVNKANFKGFTSLMLCPGAYVFYERSGIRCINLLLKSGARVNMRNTNGQNALDFYFTESRRPKTSVKLLLYAAGETIDHSTVKLQDLLAQFTDGLEYNLQFFSLQHLCREAIRNHLTQNNRNRNLFLTVPQLVLPTMLKSYLLYGMTITDKDLYSSSSSDDSSSDTE